MLSIHRISWKFSVIVINSSTQLNVRIVLLMDLSFYNWIPVTHQVPCCQTSEDVHKYVIALKECLLRELEPEQMNSNCTALGHPYNEQLHTSMQTFWDFFSSGVTTQIVACSECNNVTTRDERFSELILKFPQQPSAVESQNYTLASLYQHYMNGWEDKINDYVCVPCNRHTSAT
jgi:hypothetical protein